MTKTHIPYIDNLVSNTLKQTLNNTKSETDGSLRLKPYRAVIEWFLLDAIRTVH